MDNSIAVIDLGTNTCNLLIASFQEKNYKILFQGKEVVKLGKNGIGNNQLTEDGLERAILAIKKHQAIIEKYTASEILLIGTSAIREASNRDWFIQQVKSRTGLELNVISGEQEAELIFEGVKMAFPRIENHSLILDIGGGSNEFILVDSGMPVWKESFPLGMARLIEAIPLSNPITTDEIAQVEKWFDSKLCDLWKRTENLPIARLIGCSGAFDTVADLIDQTAPGTKTRISQEIKLQDFERIYTKLVKSTTSERMAMKGMEPIRVEMIVPAVIFIKLIIDRLNIQKIVQTDFALREGVLYEQIFS
jgi:exopolyphosphatase/guanosine-5'-triphosphate,3'-diphosphate pyrophosphatase